MEKSFYKLIQIFNFSKSAKNISFFSIFNEPILLVLNGVFMYMNIFL